MHKVVLFCLLGCLFLASPASAQRNAREYAVEASAAVQTSPPKISLHWPAAPANSYTIYRRTGLGGWSQVATLSGGATGYEDTSVSAGTGYEYQIVRTGDVTAYGFIYSGINLPLVEFRGRVVLVIDSSHSAALANDLWVLQQNLIGDGWQISSIFVSPSDSPAHVRNQIRAVYNADPQNTRAVLLFGHIPVPYSGNIAPDGHENHRGAWPADVFYGEMQGEWTDHLVNNTSAERSVNWNVPGDGKYDQSHTTTAVDLEVGRVDMWNLTAFANNAPARSERDLLRAYIWKNHNYRHKVWSLPRRGLVFDNFGSYKGFDPVAAGAWRNFAAMFGANTSQAVGPGNYISTLASSGYLMAYSAGGGQYFTMDGIGDVNEFARNSLRTVFTMHMGSYFGDWNNENNWMRSILGSSHYTLTASYSGFPHNFFHHMAMGSTVGYGIRLSQNNEQWQYPVVNQGTREVHISLLGDPALRLHPVAPPSNVSVAAGTSGAVVTWSSSPDSGIGGYNVYRASGWEGFFGRINQQPVTGNSFTDNTVAVAGNYIYMVRAIKLEQSASGTYWNASQGIFTSGNIAPPASPAPVPPPAPNPSPEPAPSPAPAPQPDPEPSPVPTPAFTTNASTTSLFGFDKDGDKKMDITVYHPATGGWYFNHSSGGSSSAKWGWPSAQPLRGDFDGDGKTDPAVYDPATGIWYIQYSTGGSTAVKFGWPGVTPVPGDYDGDRRTDFAVYDRSSGTWYLRESSASADKAIKWGWSEALPYAGDFDGDGRSDLAVYHAPLGDWYIRFSSGESTSIRWGWNSATPVLADYDGDGRTDFAVYDPLTGIWYFRHSGPMANFGNGHQYALKWGWTGVVPVAGDYDGDGKGDVAVYEQTTGDWYLRMTSGSQKRVRFGWPEAIAP